jgi:hypothetical protein
MRASLLEEPRSWLLESDGCENEEYLRITSDNDLMCSGETRELTATPAGGSFYIADGPGSVEGNILTATGSGVIVVEYVVSLENCTSSVFQAISSKQTATSRLNPAENRLCIGQTTTLTGIPSGGTFEVISGPGVIDSNILITIDTGDIELLYTVPVLGCISRDEALVVSKEWPVVDIEMLNSDLLVAVPETGNYQWLFCDQGFEAIEGATESTFLVSTSGSYAVVLMEGTCADTSACVEIEITAVDHGSAGQQVVLYPNPAMDMIYVTGAGSGELVHIAIADVNGRLVAPERSRSGNAMVLSLQGLTAGVYVMVMEVDGKRIFRRFVKS